MTTLAFDAAKSTGIAVVSGAELLYLGRSVNPTLSQALATIAPLVQLGITQVAIEAAQARGGTSVRERAQSQGTLKQAQWIGVWTQVARELLPRVPCASVYPATWRSALRFPSGDRKHLKALSLAAARARWPHVEWKTDDQSDAALMALAVENTPSLWTPR
jgi:hypothetical protein